MKRALIALGIGGLGLVGAAVAFQNVTTELPPSDGARTAAPGDAAASPDAPAANTDAAPASTAPVPPALSKDPVTPMNERVAVIGLLNKRNGLWRDLTMKPGQALRVGDAIVRLRACETTAPWESQRLTGAFVQLDVRQRDQKFYRVFSGWVFKESPSLNVVEHPLYDVWPKSCAMRYPDVGPDTVTASSVGRIAARRDAPEGEAAPAAPEGAAAAADTSAPAAATD